MVYVLDYANFTNHEEFLSELLIGFKAPSLCEEDAKEEC